MSTQPTEAQLADLTTKLAESEQLLTQAREALDASERKRQIERELTAQGTLDLDTAALLTETAVAGMKQTDINAAVTDLKRRKPFLFRPPPTRAASAMSSHAEPAEPLSSAAIEARDSGDRRALLSYLRLRRGGK